MLMCIEDII